MEWIIKRFDDLSPAELYEILSLRDQVFIVEQDCPYQDVDGKDPHSYHLFGKDSDGTICAYLRVLEKGQTFAEISIGRVLVRKDRRGAGLARQMLKKAVAFVHDRLRERAIRIEAQAYLKKFYMEIGFRPCSEVYLEDGIPHIEMVMS